VKDWQRGYELALLKSLAAIFKADLGAHCYGAFGLPKERDVADALAEERLVWTNDGGDEPAGVAMVAQAKAPSTHRDFAEREAHIQAGDVLIRSLAGSTSAKARIIGALIDRTKGAALWAEGPVEAAETVELLADAGFAHVMTKVAASSDLRGLWLRGEPQGRAPAPLAPADVPALAILHRGFASADEIAAVLAEADAAAWAQHYSSYNKRGTWTAVALRGFDPADPSFIIKPAEMSRQWKAENAARLAETCDDTVLAERFPAAMALAARIPGDKQRVRLMRLAAEGGELTRHADITDPEAGTQDGQVARLHIPLRSPADCVFRGWAMDGAEHRVHFPEGALCYLDTRKPHAVLNPGELDRIHLVVDTFATPELRAWIAG
jgi:hypothetical protein